LLVRHPFGSSRAATAKRQSEARGLLKAAEGHAPHRARTAAVDRLKFSAPFQIFKCAKKMENKVMKPNTALKTMIPTA
jgi:hypothetical protein